MIKQQSSSNTVLCVHNILARMWILWAMSVFVLVTKAEEDHAVQILSFGTLMINNTSISQPILQNYMKSSHPLTYVLKKVTTDTRVSLLSAVQPADCQRPTSTVMFCINEVSGEVYIIPVYKDLIVPGRSFKLTIEVRDDAHLPVIVQNIIITLQVVGNCDSANVGSNSLCPTTKAKETPTEQPTVKTIKYTQNPRPTKKTINLTRKPPKSQRKAKLSRKAQKPQFPEGKNVIEGGKGLIEGTLNVVKAVPVITQNVLFMIPTICVSAVVVSGASMSVAFAVQRVVRNKRDQKKRKDDENDNEKGGKGGGGGGEGGGFWGGLKRIFKRPTNVKYEDMKKYSPKHPEYDRPRVSFTRRMKRRWRRFKGLLGLKQSKLSDEVADLLIEITRERTFEEVENDLKKLDIVEVVDLIKQAFRFVSSVGKGVQYDTRDERYGIDKWIEIEEMFEDIVASGLSRELVSNIMLMAWHSAWALFSSRMDPHLADPNHQQMFEYYANQLKDIISKEPVPYGYKFALPSQEVSKFLKDMVLDILDKEPSGEKLQTRFSDEELKMREKEDSIPWLDFRDLIMAEIKKIDFKAKGTWQSQTHPQVVIEKLVRDKNISLSLAHSIWWFVVVAKAFRKKELKEREIEECCKVLTMTPQV